MIRTWHIVGLLVAIAAATGACGDSGGGGGNGGNGGSGGTGGTGGAGQLDCAGLIDCVTKCTAGDQACATACGDRGFDWSRQKAQGKLDCLGANSCTNVNCAECQGINKVCTDDDGKSGLNCVEFNQCLVDCNGNTDCATACGISTPKASGDLQQALVMCGTDNGCTDQACYQTKCPTEYNACISDP